MATLNIVNFPDDLYQTLADYAKINRRSISEEVIYLLEQALKKPVKEKSSTITQLVDVACDAQERRAKWREEAHEKYAKSNPKYVWESTEGEDFV